MMGSQTRLAGMQEQIAAGSKTLRPSDDPVGAGQAILLREAESQLTQYQRSGERAESILTSEESALASLGDLIVSIRGLVLQANNDTLGESDKASILTELNTNKEDVLALINSTDVNGNYLFSGSQVDAKPWPTADPNGYQGDTGKRTVTIGPGNTINLGTAALELMNFSHTDATGTNTTVNLLQTIEAIEGHLATPITDAQAHVDYHAAMDVALGELTSAQSNISLHRSSAGYGLSEIDRSRENNSDSTFQIQTELARVEDLDYAEAITRMESELASLQALQATYSRMQNLTLFNRL
jgi:flagellar hook-associated protein 3 FlgL